MAKFLIKNGFIRLILQKNNQILFMLKKWLKKLPFALTKNHAYDLQAKKIIDKVVHSSALCIDVGCHEGEFLDMFLKKAPTVSHLGFEPLPDFYQNLQKKYGKQCQIFNTALSDQKGESTFNYVVSNPAYSGLQKRNYDKPNEKDTTISVQTDLLDHLINPNTKIDFIKIDVEGGEYQVLKGAQKTITTHQPHIIFEHGLGAADVYGTTPEMIYELLVENCGLNLSTMEAWLKQKGGFSKDTFCRHFYKNLDYYFIAFPVKN